MRRRLLGGLNLILVSFHTRLWNSVPCPIILPPPSTLLLARLKSGGTGVLGIGRCIWEPKDDLFSACKR